MSKSKYNYSCKKCKKVYTEKLAEHKDYKCSACSGKLTKRRKAD